MFYLCSNVLSQEFFTPPTSPPPQYNSLINRLGAVPTSEGPTLLPPRISPPPGYDSPFVSPPQTPPPYTPSSNFFYDNQSAQSSPPFPGTISPPQSPPSFPNTPPSASTTDPFSPLPPPLASIGSPIPPPGILHGLSNPYPALGQALVTNQPLVVRNRTEQLEVPLSSGASNQTPFEQAVSSNNIPVDYSAPPQPRIKRISGTLERPPAPQRYRSEDLQDLEEQVAQETGLPFPYRRGDLTSHINARLNSIRDELSRAREEEPDMEEEFALPYRQRRRQEAVDGDEFSTDVNPVHNPNPFRNLVTNTDNLVRPTFVHSFFTPEQQENLRLIRQIYTTYQDKARGMLYSSFH